MDETDAYFSFVIAAILLTIGISESRRADKRQNLGQWCLGAGAIALLLGFWGMA